MMTDLQSQSIWQLIQTQDRPLVGYVDRDRVRTLSVRMLQCSFDGTLWFPVIWHDVIARDLCVNDSVCVVCRNTELDLEVCLNGSISFTRDRQLLKSLCLQAQSRATFVYPENLNLRQDGVLLEVHVDRAETWDLTTGSHQLLYTNDR